MSVFILTCNEKWLQSCNYWSGNSFTANWLHAKWYATEFTAELNREAAAAKIEVKKEQIFVVEMKPTEEDIQQHDSF